MLGEGSAKKYVAGVETRKRCGCCNHDNRRVGEDPCCVTAGRVGGWEGTWKCADDWRWEGRTVEGERRFRRRCNGGAELGRGEMPRTAAWWVMHAQDFVPFAKMLPAGD